MNEAGADEEENRTRTDLRVYGLLYPVVLVCPTSRCVVKSRQDGECECEADRRTRTLAVVQEEPASGVRRTCVLSVFTKARSGLRDVREDSLSFGLAVVYLCLASCELYGYSRTVGGRGSHRGLRQFMSGSVLERPEETTSSTHFTSE